MHSQVDNTPSPQPAPPSTLAGEQSQRRLVLLSLLLCPDVEESRR